MEDMRRVISDLGGPGGVPSRKPGTLLLASGDLEWSKNYRVTKGNQAFCYFLVWLTLPARARPVRVHHPGAVPVHQRLPGHRC